MSITSDNGKYVIKFVLNPELTVFDDIIENRLDDTFYKEHYVNTFTQVSQFIQLAESHATFIDDATINVDIVENTNTYKDDRYVVALYTTDFDVYYVVFDKVTINIKHSGYIYNSYEKNTVINVIGTWEISERNVCITDSMINKVTNMIERKMDSVSTSNESSVYEYCEYYEESLEGPPRLLQCSRCTPIKCDICSPNVSVIDNGTNCMDVLTSNNNDPISCIIVGDGVDTNNKTNIIINILNMSGIDHKNIIIFTDRKLSGVYREHYPDSVIYTIYDRSIIKSIHNAQENGDTYRIVVYDKYDSKPLSCNCPYMEKLILGKNNLGFIGHASYAYSIDPGFRYRSYIFTHNEKSKRIKNVASHIIENKFRYDSDRSAKIVDNLFNDNKDAVIIETSKHVKNVITTVRFDNAL